MGACFVGLDWVETITGSSEVLQASDGLWKWNKEALFYSKTGNTITCQKCPNFCQLGLNDTGKCRNRVSYQGKLYSIAYGNPCAVHIDPIEKKPLYHFLPTTRAFSIAAAGCNFRCLNCQNWQISQVSPKETANADLMPQAVVEQCVNSGCESIAYTYSEPISFYEYVMDTSKLARAKKIRNVFKSNGYINEEPLRLLCKNLDAANIDLKCFDEGIYARLSGGKLAPILKTLKTLKQEGVWLEITNLVVPSWTDNLDMIKRMSDWLAANGLGDCPLHFTRFSPLYKLSQLPLTPVSTLEKAREIALQAGMRYVYVGNVPGHAAENTYCHGCNKLIVERKGFRILSNNIAQNKCRFCGEKIPGVWA
ncbi:MAG: AmmeMemoRadiSam system radical SAM enzyme [Acidobacteriia bacterium]|nr:AmmeMemoRadiSam system radical SAM enzyme [Terriglobia bacterium]